MKEEQVLFDEGLAVLYTCASIMLEPHENLVQHLKTLDELAPFDASFQINPINVEAEYIELFSVKSSAYKTVPYASWWIDGVMMGKSFSRIEDFYQACGFKPDFETIKLPSDHIGFLLLFTVILYEEERYEEANFFFDTYLGWLKDLSLNIEKINNKSIFVKILQISNQVLTTLKEESLCLKQ